MQFWDHQFTKLDKEFQIGEQIDVTGEKVPVMAQKMICVHCNKEFIQNKDARPQGPCPARNDKREMKRIKLS